MKKKIQFPKIKKHLHNFLTDESGKISKHNALGFGAVGAVMGLIDGADAHHCSDIDLPGEAITNSWSGGFDGARYYNTDASCGHASSIFSGTWTNYSELSGGTSVIRPAQPASLGAYPDYICVAGGGMKTVGGTTTMYRNCGTFTTGSSGHMSNIGNIGDSTETATHTNRHSNY